MVVKHHSSASTRRRHDLLMGIQQVGVKANAAALAVALMLLPWSFWPAMTAQLTSGGIFYYLYRKSRLFTDNKEFSANNFMCSDQWACLAVATSSLILLEVAFLSLFFGPFTLVEIYFFYVPISAIITVPTSHTKHKFFLSLFTFLVFAGTVVLFSYGFKGFSSEHPHEYVSALYSGVNAFFSFLMLSLLLSRFRDDVDRAEDEAQNEKDVANRLLNNVLPSTIVEKLKTDPSKLPALEYDKVTVGFIDIVDFTRFAAEIPAIKVQAVLNHFYNKLDALADSLDIEKIKTIGDSYMFASGIFDNASDSASRSLKFTWAAIEATRELSAVFDIDFHVRCGVATGPVAAGVIGKKRFLFDLWGGTVNLASRLEARCEAGGVMICPHTKEILQTTLASQNDWCFSERIELNVKGIGSVKAYQCKLKSEHTENDARNFCPVA